MLGILSIFYEEANISIMKMQPSGTTFAQSSDVRMIHPHTYIHPNANLATNVKIDPFTVIHQNVEIGEGTWIGSNVTIMEGARIGKNCRIFPGAVIAAIPQDLKFEGEDTQCIDW